MALAVTSPGNRSGVTAAMLLAGAVGLLALPSAVLAFSSRFAETPDFATPASADSELFRSAQVDPRLARSITVRALNKDQSFRFTPAATPTRIERSVTVAVRLDGARAGTIMRRGPLATSDSLPTLRIAPTAYSLGTTRGYKGFAQNGNAAPEVRKIDAMPDLAAFKPSAGARADNSRFSPRIALDEKDKTGRSPRTFEGQDEARVDVGGSYRLTRNLNVTAGVRYQQERDRLAPLTDGKQDSQAVYVGTQFKF